MSAAMTGIPPKKSAERAHRVSTPGSLGKRVMKKINISSYLQPTRADDAGDQMVENGACRPPKHDPTYSALLGYGFTGMPKLLPPEPQPDRKTR
jgi:hypothetical protein